MSEVASSNRAASSTELEVPMRHVVQFVRQLCHDLRNHLNAAELQAAFLKEIAADEEMKIEVQRLRAMVSEIGGSLQRLTSALAPVKLTMMPYEASAFVEDLQQKVAQRVGEQAEAFAWDMEAAKGMLEIDPQLLQQAMLELFDNALQHSRASGPIRVAAEASRSQLSLTISEPKRAFDASTANWGHEPFKVATHGHYSLGLHRARNIIEAHGGALVARYDSNAALLVTTISLPLADERA